MELNYWKFMREALEFGNIALINNEVPVSAILVDNETGKIWYRAHNMTNKLINGTLHAEFQIYNYLLENEDDHLKIWQNSTLFVTVEPCIMCASMLDQVGIGKVVFGCPNERFGGNGSVFKINYKSNYKIIPGVGHKDAISLLRKFYIGENKHNPNSINKKKRVLNIDSFPILNYEKYISRDEFISIWGVENVKIFDNNYFLEFNDNGEVLCDDGNKKVKI